jgi:hypothetical protein
MLQNVYLYAVAPHARVLIYCGGNNNLNAIQDVSLAPSTTLKQTARNKPRSI